MAWYYGPGKHQNILHVFSSKTKPNESSHGHWVKYGVGPFPTAKLAVKAATTSRAHAGWPVFLKRKGPRSQHVNPYVATHVATVESTIPPLYNPGISPFRYATTRSIHNFPYGPMSWQLKNTTKAYNPKRKRR